MKEFQIVARGDQDSQNLKNHYHHILTKNNFIESENPDIVISIGGDGTMLEAFRKFHSEKAHFVSLHTGTLGFYSDWHKDESDELLNKILSENGEVVSYPLLELTFHLSDNSLLRHLSLNETIFKSKTLSTFKLEVYINNKRFQTYRGDGIIISTPSGSTAYNHSVGGSILHPTLEAIQVSQLAAINNKEFRTLDRSFVLPNHHKLSLYPKNPDSDILIGIDGVQINMKDIYSIDCQVSHEKIKFIRYRPFPFWERVREKFLSE
jgi:NAD+ kinase